MPPVAPANTDASLRSVPDVIIVDNYTLPCKVSGAQVAWQYTRDQALATFSLGLARDGHELVIEVEGTEHRVPLAPNTLDSLFRMLAPHTSHWPVLANEAVQSLRSTEPDLQPAPS